MLMCSAALDKELLIMQCEQIYDRAPHFRKYDLVRICRQWHYIHVSMDRTGTHYYNSSHQLSWSILSEFLFTSVTANEHR